MGMRDPWRYELAAWQEGFDPVCGLDEAGRGPLAGGVFAAAVILPPDFDTRGLDDSKKLREAQRETQYARICAGALAWAVAAASPAEIDRINILEASLLAMRRALAALPLRPAFLLVDGNTVRGFDLPARAVIGGDGASASIAAASILAKVERDRYMCEMAERYPAYRFEQHKGYPTKLHYDLLELHGPCPLHRCSFLRKHAGVLAARELIPAGAGVGSFGEEAFLHNGESVPPGGFGEEAAARYLEQKGYAILARNYRVRGGELDIVARDGPVLVFVEVKQRRDADFAPAADAVDAFKRKRLLRAAQGYLDEHRETAPARVDVIEVYTGPPEETAFGPTYADPVIRHLKDALG